MWMEMSDNEIVNLIVWKAFDKGYKARDHKRGGHARGLVRILHEESGCELCSCQLQLLLRFTVELKPQFYSALTCSQNTYTFTYSIVATR